MKLKLRVNINNINIKNRTWNKVFNTVNPKSSSPGPLRTSHCPEFQRKLPTLSLGLGKSQLQQFMNWPGEGGLGGVYEQKLINFGVI